MRRIRRTQWLLAFLSILPMACTSVCVSEATYVPTRSPSAITKTSSSPERAPLGLASFGSPVAVNPSTPRVEADQQAGPGELSVEALVQQVLDRNPSLAQMVAAWQAASARYPQVTSLEDPMLTGKLGPGALGSNNVNGGYMVEISQKLPFPGKLKLRGQSAQAEANAAGLDVEDMRLQLIENAQSAFYDYYLVARALEWNEESLKLWQRAKQDASTRYEAGKVEQQDVLQANVEIGREQERRLGLEEMRKIAIARMNTLMHLAPDNTLPPPPRDIKLHETLPQAAELRALAVARRPELQALANRIDAERAALALARKEFLPDVELMAGYDSFWQEKELRAQVGMRINLPVYKGRRYGAIDEAQAKIAQRQAELDRQTDQVSFQVQEGYEKTLKAEKSVRLYEKTILPTAELNAKAARSAYVAGKISALSRIEAERNLVTLRDRYYEAVADYFRRRATLERVIGGPVVRPE